MFDCQDAISSICIGDGSSITATKIGKKKMTILQQDGSTMDIILHDVKFIPELKFNLFSVIKAVAQGKWKLTSEGIYMILTKGDARIKFDQVLPTDSGMLLGIEMVPRTDEAYAMQQQNIQQTMNVNAFHERLGHTNEETTRTTAKHYNIKLTGKFEPCFDCAIAKAKQKNTNKETSNKATKPGERICIDISSTKEESYSGGKFWLLITDEYSNMIWTAILKQKTELPARVLKFIKNLKAQENIEVKSIRCDDSGENRFLQTLCQHENIKVEFEYTGPGTPQYNGKVERRFATLYGKVRSMLNSAKLPKEMRNKLWAEASSLVTLIDNLLVKTN
jgi:hypothetical protein